MRFKYRFGVAALMMMSSLSPGMAADSNAPARPDITLFSIESRYVPSLKLEDPAARSFEEEARVDVRYVQTRLLLPWRKKTGRASVSASLGYESLSFSYHNWDESADPTTADQLHAIQFPISIRVEFNDPRWGLFSFLTPGFNSDFKSISSRSIRLQGGVLFNRTVNKRTVSMGAVLINDYGSPRVYPAFAYAGRISEKQNIVIRLPVLLSWGVDLSAATEAGLAARVSGNNFYISEEGRHRGHTARYSVGSVGPYVKWKPLSSLLISVEAGATFHHDLEYWDGNKKDRDLDFRPAPVLLASVRVLL